MGEGRLHQQLLQGDGRVQGDALPQGDTPQHGDGGCQGTTSQHEDKGHRVAKEGGQEE